MILVLAVPNFDTTSRIMIRHDVEDSRYHAPESEFFFRRLRYARKPATRPGPDGALTVRASAPDP